MELSTETLLFLLRPALEASQDPIAVVNTRNRIIWATASMRTTLGLRARALEQKPVFCDAIKLKACKEKCCVLEAIKTGKTMAYTEVPATIGTAKLRVQLRIVPIAGMGTVQEIPGHDGVGAIVSLRDTSPELLLQAKYQKLKALLQQRDEMIRVLQELIDKG